MGTLGGDFLSSLPLHEYPPAFPLGADIQGRTLTITWDPKLPCPSQNQIIPLLLFKAFWLSLQRAIIQGNFLFLAMKGSDRRLILIFFLPGLDLFSFLHTESQVSVPFSYEDLRSLKIPFWTLMGTLPLSFSLEI